MKPYYLLLLLFLSSFAAVAQSTKKDTVYVSVDTMPSFNGGDQAWVQYLIHNITYPPEAMNNRDTGRIIVQFMVNTKGKISNVKALNGPPILQKEAERLLKESPKWIPAIKNGEKVSCLAQQIVSFSLQG